MRDLPRARVVGDGAFKMAVPERCRCGARYREDASFRRQVQQYAPALAIRVFRCWNGHSLTFRPPPAVLWPTFVAVCDTCGEPFESYRENAKRHPACAAEHERRRKRLALTSRPEVVSHGRR